MTIDYAVLNLRGVIRGAYVEINEVEKFKGFQW